jgi:hypothetical protein
MNEKCKKIFFSTNGCNVQELAGTYVPPMRIYAHTQESVKYCVLRIYIFVILRMRLRRELDRSLPHEFRIWDFTEKPELVKTPILTTIDQEKSA